MLVVLRGRRLNFYNNQKKKILFVLIKTALTSLQKNHLKVKKKGIKTFANICT